MVWLRILNLIKVLVIKYWKVEIQDKDKIKEDILILIYLLRDIINEYIKRVMLKKVIEMRLRSMNNLKRINHINDFKLIIYNFDKSKLIKRITISNLIMNLLSKLLTGIIYKNINNKRKSKRNSIVISKPVLKENLNKVEILFYYNLPYYKSYKWFNRLSKYLWNKGKQNKLLFINNYNKNTYKNTMLLLKTFTINLYGNILNNILIMRNNNNKLNSFINKSVDKLNNNNNNSILGTNEEKLSIIKNRRYLLKLNKSLKLKLLKKIRNNDIKNDLSLNYYIKNILVLYTLNNNNNNINNNVNNISILLNNVNILNDINNNNNNINNIKSNLIINSLNKLVKDINNKKNNTISDINININKLINKSTLRNNINIRNKGTLRNNINLELIRNYHTINNNNNNNNDILNLINNKNNNIKDLKILLNNIKLNIKEDELKTNNVIINYNNLINKNIKLDNLSLNLGNKINNGGNKVKNDNISKEINYVIWSIDKLLNNLNNISKVNRSDNNLLLENNKLNIILSKFLDNKEVEIKPIHLKYEFNNSDILGKLSIKGISKRRRIVSRRFRFRLNKRINLSNEQDILNNYLLKLNKNELEYNNIIFNISNNIKNNLIINNNNNNNNNNNIKVMYNDIKDYLNDKRDLNDSLIHKYIVGWGLSLKGKIGRRKGKNRTRKVIMTKGSFKNILLNHNISNNRLNLNYINNNIIKSYFDKHTNNGKLGLWVTFNVI